VNEYVLFTLSSAVSLVVNVWGRLRGRPDVERILIVKLDHIGDVVLATPVLRALRERLPDARIDVLLLPETAPLLEGHPCVDHVLTYRSPRYARSPGTAEGMRRLREIAATRYTTIVELRGDGRTLLLPFWTGARRRVDRGTLRLFRRLGMRSSGRHELETNLEIVRPLTGTIPAPPVETRARPAAQASMQRKLEERGIEIGRPFVVIHPGAAWKPKTWPPERFGAVADWILGHYDARVLLVGGPSEREIEDAVARSIARNGAQKLAGVLSLEELMALLQRTALFIGNDSGPAHMAAAVGVATIVLFGPSDPSRFAPRSERTFVLHHPGACVPCGPAACIRPEDPCLNRNEVADVIARAREVLGAPRDAHGELATG
jgi:predicted lipopolysaccharide heptosyltransferase III